LAYQDTIQVVKDFVDANPGTVVISTSDHETGGFTLGRQTSPEYPEYKWYVAIDSPSFGPQPNSRTLIFRNPDVIKRVQASAEALTRNIMSQTSLTSKYIEKVVVEQGLGITDATKDELEYLKNWQENNLTSSNIEEHLANMVSVRALIGVS
jgi:alkaline phosphatase